MCDKGDGLDSGEGRSDRGHGMDREVGEADWVQGMDRGQSRTEAIGEGQKRETTGKGRQYKQRVHEE